MKKLIVILMFCSNFSFSQIDKCDLLSDGSGKSLGVKFKTRIPCNFIEKVPQRPHIAKSYTTETEKNGKRVSIVIGINSLGEMPSKSEKDVFFSESSLKSMSPKNSTLISSRSLFIDGESAAEIKSSQTREGIDGKVGWYNVQYLILYKEKLISIIFGVYGKTEDDAKTFYLQEENSIKTIIGNFVILSKYQ